MSIDDETLMAFADGELPEARMAEVAAAVAADPDLAAKVGRLRAVRARLAGALGDLEPPNDLMARAQRAQAARAVRPRAWGVALAAGVAGLVIGAGAVLGFQPGGGVGGDFRARGGLHAALDAAASGTVRGDVAPLYTVITADGRPCRAFRAEGRGGTYEGVACREGHAWRVLAVAAATVRGGGFEPASSDTPQAVEAILEALAPGDPLSAQAERELIASDWTRRE